MFTSEAGEFEVKSEVVLTKHLAPSFIFRSNSPYIAHFQSKTTHNRNAFIAISGGIHCNK